MTVVICFAGDGCPNLVMDDVVDTQDFHHTHVTTEIEQNQQAQGFIQNVRPHVGQHTSKHSLEYGNIFCKIGFM